MHDYALSLIDADGNIVAWYGGAERIYQYTSEEALVATDHRVHWDDLPPGRRQNFNLLVATGGAALLAGSAAAGVAAWLRRRRRSP